MLPTILILLSVTVIVFAAISCFMFLTVAFAGPNPKGSSATLQSWEMPPDNRNALANWASRLTASVTSNQLGMSRSSKTAMNIVRELYAGTADAMETLQAEAGPCPARCHEMIGVTAPEALAIVDNMKSQLDEAEVKRIRESAAANTSRTESMSPTQYASSNVTCPLYTEGGNCAAYPFRPLFCRTDCADCSSEATPSDTADAPLSLLAAGIDRGLSKSLKAAGVDGSHYELNSVLLAALASGDISGRWANGEPVFSECKQFLV